MHLLGWIRSKHLADSSRSSSRLVAGFRSTRALSITFGLIALSSASVNSILTLDLQNLIFIVRYI